MGTVMRSALKETFSHITSVEIPDTGNVFLPGKSRFKDFMKEMGVSIICVNQCFVDIACLNKWLDVVTSRTLFHVQSLERSLSDGGAIAELGRVCDITLLQFLELIKIHERNIQYCGLHTNGYPNVVYLWPPRESIYHHRLCAISFSRMVGKSGGWMFNAVPMNDPVCIRNEGTNVVSRCFAQDSFTM